MPYIYSTMSADVLYNSLKRNNAGNIVQTEGILIKGGANVVAKRGDLITPRGVRTEVTDDQLARLEKDQLFNLHKENGFVTVDGKRNANDVAKNMQKKDKSGQKTPVEIEAEVEAARKAAENAGG
jgi:hypothetical protein